MSIAIEELDEVRPTLLRDLKPGDLFKRHHSHNDGDVYMVTSGAGAMSTCKAARLGYASTAEPGSRFINCAIVANLRNGRKVLIPRDCEVTAYEGRLEVWRARPYAGMRVRATLAPSWVTDRYRK